MDDALQRADVAWDRRDDQGFEPVIAALDEAEAQGHEVSEIAWRRARAQVGWGLASPSDTEALKHFASARAAAVACADTRVAFADARRRQAWEEALRASPPQDCVDWAAWSWLRWLERAGPEAMALDLEAVDALALQLKPGTTIRGGTSTDWILGLNSSIRQDPRAAKHLWKAHEDYASVLWIQLDRLNAQTDNAPEGEERLRLLEELRAATPTTPEDREAWRRASRLR